MQQQYVVGFMFDSNDCEHVALIRKLKPLWQKGKLNGIGGKLETGEFIYDAMVREFEEETGHKTRTEDWVYFAKLSGEQHIVYFFAATGFIFQDLKSVEEEQIEIVRVDKVSADDSIPNLTWLIPLAKLALNNQTYRLMVQEVA